MLNAVSSFIENVHEKVDPSYLKEKEEAKKQLQGMEIVSIASSLASIAGVMFGVSVTNSGALGAVVGLPFIAVCLPLGYVSYNAYQVSKNMNDVVDNPKKYQRFGGLDPNVDTQKLKEQLVKDTFCFDWAIDLVVENMAKSNKE